MTYRILAICTGNICRSPLTQQLLDARLAGLPIECASAGTAALDGQHMDARAAAHSIAHGGQPEPHRAAQLTEACVRDAALILTATRAHRRTVVEMLPRATRHTFTLPEFARLLAAVNDDDWADIRSRGTAAGRLATLAEAAASGRGLNPPPAEPSDDDVVDPYRQDDAVYDTAVEQILAAVGQIAPALRHAAEPR